MGYNIECLRCGRKMNHIKTEKLQFGQTGWILGDLSNLLAGAMEVDIYSCPKCKKLESLETTDFTVVFFFVFLYNVLCMFI